MASNRKCARERPKTYKKYIWDETGLVQQI
jgi:hypothetical protein